MADPSDNDTLGENAAARFLVETPATLERWRRQGKGPPWSTLAGSVIYRRGDLRAFLAKQVAERAKK
jgi:hypothetical protein